VLIAILLGLFNESVAYLATPYGRIGKVRPKLREWVFEEEGVVERRKM
jgi:hypothetical protein